MHAEPADRDWGDARRSARREHFKIAQRRFGVLGFRSRVHGAATSARWFSRRRGAVDLQPQLRCGRSTIRRTHAHSARSTRGRERDARARVGARGRGKRHAEISRGRRRPERAFRPTPRRSRRLGSALQVRPTAVLFEQRTRVGHARRHGKIRRRKLQHLGRGLSVLDEEITRQPRRFARDS